MSTHLNGFLYIDHLVDHESLYKITYEPDDDDGIEENGDEDESEAPGAPVPAETSASVSED